MRRCYCVITRPLTRGIKKMEPQKRDNYTSVVKNCFDISNKDL